ncbi:MAG: hypothetical protein H8E32_06345 [Nitrospinae bacterium]|nr:hypothetical protein [Nitrospinota bacterium]
MSNQKYFYKGRDLIQLRNRVLNWLITLIFTLAGVFSFFVSPGYSLGWQDDEWIQASCPRNASGDWVIDNPASTNLKSLSLNKNEITYTYQIYQGKRTQKFEIINSIFVSNSPFVEIKLKSFENKKETIIKIRPHLVHMDLKENRNSCLIKVFNFETEKHAKTDRYSGWNIFRLSKH